MEVHNLQKDISCLTFLVHSILIKLDMVGSRRTLHDKIAVSRQDPGIKFQNPAQIPDNSQIILINPAISQIVLVLSRIM